MILAAGDTFRAAAAEQLTTWAERAGGYSNGVYDVHPYILLNYNGSYSDMSALAHELGHALGLPHVSDPRSIMCCVAAGVDFADVVVREAYVEARRNPNVRSVRVQLGEHYGRVWGQEGR